jgi:poly(A) polymerase
MGAPDDENSRKSPPVDPLEAALSAAFDRVVPTQTRPETAGYEALTRPRQGSRAARALRGGEQAAGAASLQGSLLAGSGMVATDSSHPTTDVHTDELGESDILEVQPLDPNEAADDDGASVDLQGESDSGDGPDVDDEVGPEVDDPEEAARLAALSGDLDAEAPDEAPEGEIPVDRIDEDALKVVRRLHHFGYEAYLVGGCVRDLLLGRKPKDFDVATSADPNQIRQVFRNCRLIGRRFRLAHIYFFGGKVVETSTFRANPLDEMDDLPKDLLISQDNVFGTSQEDARRRDFTVNALFYDPQTGRVVDHVGGRADLEARVIRTIGEPDVRLREDPVRILRAVKFASRLGFSLDPITREAMARHAAEITRCAAPRVLEEIYRLLASGSARRAFELLLELNIVPALIPEVAPALGFVVEGGPPPAENGEVLCQEILAVLDALDACKERGVEPSHALSLGALLLRLYARLQTHGQDANKWLDDVSMSLVTRLRLTRRDRERVRLLLHTQRHLTPDRRRGGAARATVRRGPFLEALLLYTLDLYSRGGDLAEVGQWKAIAKTEGLAFRPGEVVDRGARQEGPKRDRRDAPGTAADDRNRRRRRGRRGGRR